MTESNINGEIILYQPDSSVQIEVRMENETVWLTQNQMACLFETTRNNVTLHINNIFKENELNKNSVCKESLLTAKDGKFYKTKFYNLDVIISVGYRVKSQRGTQFRIWANKVLKDYILKGYAVNNRIERLENDVHYLKQKTAEFDLVVKTSLPPHEGLFFEGQIFDAFEFVKQLVKSAEKSIVLIDNYLDDCVLTMMTDKNKDVQVKIFAKTVPPALLLAAEKFNAQYGNLSVKQFSFSHDRFLIIDEKEIYLIGASLKDLGKKWFAVSALDPDNISLIMKRLLK